MAKKSKIVKDQQRREVVERYREKRAQLICLGKFDELATIDKQLKIWALNF